MLRSQCLPLHLALTTCHLKLQSQALEHDVNAQAEAAIGGEGGGDETAMQVVQRRSFTFEQRNCTRAARSSSFI